MNSSRGKTNFLNKYLQQVFKFLALQINFLYKIKSTIMFNNWITNAAQAVFGPKAGIVVAGPVALLTKSVPDTNAVMDLPFTLLGLPSAQEYDNKLEQEFEKQKMLEFKKKPNLPKQEKKVQRQVVYASSEPKIVYRTVYKENRQQIKEIKQKQEELNRRQKKLNKKEILIKQEEQKMEIRSIASSSTSAQDRQKEKNMFLCPITMQLMNDPVQASCCHRFERSAIQESLKKRKQCPLCRQSLKITQLRTDSYTKGLIQHFKQKEARTAAKNKLRQKQYAAQRQRAEKELKAKEQVIADYEQKSQISSTARTKAQQDGPQTHKAQDFLENCQNGVKIGTSSKGRVYYDIRDTVQQDMDAHNQSIGLREYVGSVPFSRRPFSRYQQKMVGRTFKQ